MKKVTSFLTNNIAITILILMIIIATILDRSFLAPANLFNVFNQNSIKGIMAIGMTFLILNGYFDMSLCTLVSLAAALSCGLQNQIGIAGAVLVSLLVGALVGIINGFLVAYVGINGFVVTLATMLGCRGLAYIYPNEKSIVAPNMSFLKFGITVDQLQDTTFVNMFNEFSAQAQNARIGMHQNYILMPPIYIPASVCYYSTDELEVVEKPVDYDPTTNKYGYKITYVALQNLTDIEVVESRKYDRLYNVIFNLRGGKQNFSINVSTVDTVAFFKEVFSATHSKQSR